MINAMITAEEKNSLVQEFHNASKEMFESVKENCKLRCAMEADDVDDARDIIKRIQNVMVANIPEGLSVPKTSLYVSPVGNEGISLINIALVNKMSAQKTFKYAITVTRDNAEEKVFDFMLSAYTALIIDELVNENLKKVNDVLTQAVAESGIDYGIKIVSSLGNEGKKIASMSDDEIVFVADETRVFSLENIIVLLDGATELISEETIQKHYNSIVEELATAQTPEQLVGIHGGALVAHVCDISKRLKPMTLIKKVCSKNVDRLRGDKDTIAYYSKDDVYSLIARREGNFEVILSPFDTKTLRKVDVDVLKAIS